MISLEPDKISRNGQRRSFMFSCTFIRENKKFHFISTLSKKGDNFSDSLTIGISILIYLFSNIVLIFLNVLDDFCFTREHLLSIRQKFQLKIYNAVVSILKIPANNDLLRVYCHSYLQAKEDAHLRKIQH